MIFLIEYDRSRQRLWSIREFAHGALEQASRARFKIEAELLQSGTEREVVILEAESLEELKRTHRRYFSELAELTAGSVTPTEK